MDEMPLLGQTPEAMLPTIRPAWEYRTIDVDTDDETLNRMAREGWELVAEATRPDGTKAYRVRRRSG